MDKSRGNIGRESKIQNKKWCRRRVNLFILLRTQTTTFFSIFYSNLAHNDSFLSLFRYKKNGTDFGFFYYLWGKFGANFMYCFVIS